MGNGSGKFLISFLALTLAAAFTLAAPRIAHAQKQSCGTKNSRQLNSRTNRQDCMRNQDAAKMQVEILSEKQLERRKDLLRRQRAASNRRKFPQSNLRGRQQNRMRQLRQQAQQRTRNRR